MKTVLFLATFIGTSSAFAAPGIVIDCNGPHMNVVATVDSAKQLSSVVGYEYSRDKVTTVDWSKYGGNSAGQLVGNPVNMRGKSYLYFQLHSGNAEIGLRLPTDSLAALVAKSNREIISAPTSKKNPLNPIMQFVTNDGESNRETVRLLQCYAAEK